MRLVEQHVIKRGDPRYQRLDEAAFASKTEGRSLLVYEKGAIWKRELDQGVIAVSELPVVC